MAVEGHAHRRAAADVGDAGERIDVIERYFAGAGSPPVVAGRDRVQDPRGSVPRETAIPLHVRLVDKEAAGRRKGHVEWIAQPAGEQLPGVGLEVDSPDGSARGTNGVCMTAWIQNDG